MFNFPSLYKYMQVTPVNKNKFRRYAIKFGKRFRYINPFITILKNNKDTLN